VRAGRFVFCGSFEAEVSPCWYQGKVKTDGRTAEQIPTMGTGFVCLTCLLGAGWGFIVGLNVGLIRGSIGDNQPG
jgi:hypothetical protein